MHPKIGCAVLITVLSPVKAPYRRFRVFGYKTITLRLKTAQKGFYAVKIKSVRFLPSINASRARCPNKKSFLTLYVKNAVKYR